MSDQEHGNRDTTMEQPSGNLVAESRIRSLNQLPAAPPLVEVEPGPAYDEIPACSRPLEILEIRKSALVYGTRDLAHELRGPFVRGLEERGERVRARP